MTQTENSPIPAQSDDIEYGNHMIWRLVGSKITLFGSNANGEIFLETEKNGVITEVIIGKDEDGEVSLFEIEREEAHAE